MSNLAVVYIMEIQMTVANILEFAHSVFLIQAAHWKMLKNKSLDCVCYNYPSGGEKMAMTALIPHNEGFFKTHVGLTTM